MCVCLLSVDSFFWGGVESVYLCVVFCLECVCVCVCVCVCARLELMGGQDVPGNATVKAGE